MAVQTLIANTDVYNSPDCQGLVTLPDSLISSAEDVEDCFAKFTSLVRARDYCSSMFYVGIVFRRFISYIISK